MFSRLMSLLAGLSQELAPELFDGYPTLVLTAIAVLLLACTWAYYCRHKCRESLTAFLKGLLMAFMIPLARWLCSLLG